MCVDGLGREEPAEPAEPAEPVVRYRDRTVRLCSSRFVAVGAAPYVVLDHLTTEIASAAPNPQSCAD